ncbi:hypothetical protein ACHQM5_025723 [Ranunculus cassubicifolius]
MASKVYESHLRICLLAEHGSKDMTHSLYTIDLPSMVDSEGFEMVPVSPLLIFPERKFLVQSELVNVGSEVFFFGGTSFGHILFNNKKYEDLLRVVHVFDTKKPEKGLRRVSDMNACKEKPCVFVDNGMIYVLGRVLKNKRWSNYGWFERYIPNFDKWEILPNPPLSISELMVADWTGRATLVGREVFIGSGGKYFIFNLDALEWAKPLPASLAKCFPYGAIYIDGFLYYLRGEHLRRPDAVWDPSNDCDHVQIVRRGPLPEHGVCVDILDVCSKPKKAQVLSTAAELDGGDETFFTHNNTRSWRELLHLGGSYFCYLVTAQNIDSKTRARDYYTCFVKVMVFKVLQGNTDFCHVSSFYYRLNTQFRIFGEFIRCCALGSVPESWNEVARNKKQESRSRTEKNKKEESRSRTEKNTFLQKLPLAGREKEESRSRTEKNTFLQKLPTAKEKVNMLLAELAKKDELLKTYEAEIVALKKAKEV